MQSFLRNGLLSVLALTLLLSGCSGGRREDAPAPAKPVLPLDVAGLGAASFPSYARWLDASGTAPLEYIVRTCLAHQVVILGEHHYIKDYLELVRQAIPEVYRRAGVRVLALEVCNAEDDAKLEKLVSAPKYDLDLAYEIARAEDWELWGYKEYWDLLEAVWQLNQSLPVGAERMRVIGLDKAMDFQLDAMWRGNELKDPAAIEKAKAQPDIYKRDEWLQKAVEDGILATGAKGLILIGFNHSYTHYAQPKLGKDGKLEREWPRMAHVLYQKYGEKIRQIGLHGPHISPSAIDKTYKGGEAVFPDVIEAIMAARSGKPVGFDVVGSPFAPLRDERSYYFHWQPQATFADISRGFIFLKPVKELKPCSWMDHFISDAMFKKSRAYYEWAYKRTFKDAAEVNEFFRKGMGGL
jgi:hypothetical protein